MAMAVLALVSCKSKQQDEPAQQVQVRFNVQSIEVSQESLAPSRKADSNIKEPSDAGLSDIWVMENGNVLCHQDSSEVNFGSPDIMLTQGKHTLTFIASNKGGQKIENGVWSANSVSNTFGQVMSLNVVQGMEAQSIILTHTNYLITWKSTKVVVMSAKKARITISDHRNTLLSGLTGGSVNPLYTFEFDPTSQLGQPLDVSVSGFCGTCGVQDSVTTTLLIQTINDDTICYFSKRVSVLSNRKTILTGEIFGGTQSAISVNSNWEADNEVTL